MIINTSIEIMVGGALGFACGFIFYRYRLTAIRKESRVLLRNSFLREAREILDEVRQNTELMNAVLLHVHNSGSELLANAFLYSSVLEESPANIEVSARKVWQRVPLDRQYSDMVDDLHRADFVFLDVDKMEEGKLKDVYVMLGIRGSIVFRVYDQAKKSFIYVSFVAKVHPNDIRWQREYALLVIAKDKLTELCKKYHRKGAIQ